jgi:hypothetical protein
MSIIITIPIPGSNADSPVMIRVRIGTRNAAKSAAKSAVKNAVKSAVSANASAPGSGPGNIAMRLPATAGGSSPVIAGKRHFKMR